MTAKKFEYAPAPESRADRRPQAVLRAVHRRRVRRRRPTAARSRPSTPPPRRCWPRSPRPARRDVDRAVAAARRAYDTVWSELPARERGKYLFRIARILQERARELAVLESLDNGKPIRESRDVDVPLVAAHFFYYAGWADKLDARRLRARPAAARRRRPGHPVELPAADAGLEDRAGAGLRQHRRAQAGRDDAADRAAVRRDLPAGRPAARRRQHRHRRRRHRPRAGRARRTSTRSRSPARPRSASRSPAPSPAAARRSPSSSAARPPTSSSTTPRSTRPSRASSTASSSTRATSAAPARGCSCRRARTTRCSPRSSAGSARCASATRWTRTPTSARSTPPSSSPGSASSPTSARPRAPSAGRRRASCPTAASGSRRRVFTGVIQAHRIAREEIFGPVLSVLTFRTPARGGREGQQHAVRPVGRRLDREGLADPLDGRPAARRRGVGQHVQPVRPDLAVRRLQGVGLRPRGRPPRAGGLPRCLIAIDVRKTYKLYVGGTFPRSETGRSYEVTDRKGRFLANAAHGAPARTPATPSSPPARRSPAGRARPRTTAARSSTGSPRCWRAGAASSSTRSAPARASRAQGRGRRRRRDRPLGLVRRVVRQDRPGARRGQPGRRPVLRLLGARADRRRRRPRAAGVVAARPGLGARAGDRHRQHRRRARPASSAPLPAVTLAEVLATSDVPGGVVNVLTGRTAEVAPWLASHMDVNAIDLAGAPAPTRRPTWRSPPPTTSSGCCGRERDRLGRRPRASSGCSRSWRPRPSGTRSASDAPRSSSSTGCSPASASGALALVARAREPSVQRPREPPVGVAEKGHGRRHQHHADEGGVHEDRRGQAEAEHLRRPRPPRGRRRGTPRS